MNAADWIILGIITTAVAAAIFYLIRRKKRGASCCGDCAQCSARDSCNLK